MVMVGKHHTQPCMKSSQNYTYLHERDYYEDLFDLHTIEECLKWYWDLRKGMEKHRDELKMKDPKTDFDKEVHKACSYTVNVIKINRYRHKKETLDEWMERDRKIQEVYDNATPPHAFCDKCRSSMKIIDKTLHNTYDSNPRVSFIYQCEACKFRKILYADGSAWDYEPPKCPKCNSKLKSKYSKKGEVLTETICCIGCDYKEVEVTDFKKTRIEREKEDRRREILFKEYRSEFCLDDIEGPKAVLSLDGMCRLVDEWKAQDKKKKDPTYQKAKQLNTLKINQLKELLTKTLNENNYSDLQFSQPEMGKFVIVEFTASDNKDDRSEYDSTNTLKKAINNALEPTNWRLMSEGVHYRLGIVSGKLKAFEAEEDLMNLVR